MPLYTAAICWPTTSTARQSSTDNPKYAHTLLEYNVDPQQRSIIPQRFVSKFSIIIPKIRRRQTVNSTADPNAFPIDPLTRNYFILRQPRAVLHVALLLLQEELQLVGITRDSERLMPLIKSLTKSPSSNSTQKGTLHHEAADSRMRLLLLRSGDSKSVNQSRKV